MSLNANGHATDPSGVLDAATLARLADLDPQGNATLVKRVLSTYASSLERAHHELALARSAGQPEALRQLAHTLKSSSASVGALTLSALCAQVEHHMRSTAALEAGTLLDAVQNEMRRVTGAVQAMLRD